MSATRSRITANRKTPVRLQRMMDRDFTDELPTLSPAPQVSVQDDRVVVRLEVPGMTARNLDLQIVGHALLIRNIRAEYDVADLSGCPVAQTGQIQHLVQLPSDIDEAEAAASCANGQLTVTVPRVVVGSRQLRL